MALIHRVEFCLRFRPFWGQWSFEKNFFWDLLTFRSFRPFFFLWMLKFYAWLQNLNMDIWGKFLLCPVAKFYFSLLLEYLEPITVRLNQYLSSVTLSRFCWWSQLEIKRSQQSERRTPLRLSKEIVATTSFILYATSDRNQMKRKKKRDSCPKIALSPSLPARIMYLHKL